MELDERNREVAALQHDLDEERRRVATMTGEREAERRAAAGLREEREAARVEALELLSASHGRARELEQEGAALRTALREAVEARDRDAAVLLATAVALEESRQRLEAWRARSEDVHRSWSWRLTAPLRALGRAVRGR
jgi:septal ring factor EnvC (AmiA/AmiB activator)